MKKIIVSEMTFKGHSRLLLISFFLRLPRLSITDRTRT